MPNELLPLTATAVTIGVVHTLLGPDHYAPFIALARARAWSLRRTAAITVLCGLGHVGGSIVLGLIGIAAGIALNVLELTESIRGEVAAWLLIAFGLVYCIWGLRRAARNRPHAHAHVHDAHEHVHVHTHHGDHLHVHADAATAQNLTPWLLFVIFVFGPCEPLIPLLMYPAAAHHPWSAVLVAGVFAITTLITMLAAVLAGTFGLSLVRGRGLVRYGHAMAGGAIFLCGVAIHLGL